MNYKTKKVFWEMNEDEKLKILKKCGYDEEECKEMLHIDLDKEEEDFKNHIHNIV